MVHWVPTRTLNIIHYNCEHFITKAEKPQGFLGSAVALLSGLNFCAVLECYPDGLVFVHRHEIHQLAEQPIFKFRHRFAKLPDGFDEVLDLYLPCLFPGNLNLKIVELGFLGIVPIHLQVFLKMIIMIKLGGQY